MITLSTGSTLDVSVLVLNHFAATENQYINRKKDIYRSKLHTLRYPTLIRLIKFCVSNKKNDTERFGKQNFHV